MYLTSKHIFITFLLILMLSMTALADGTIKVKGKSEVRFVPDEVSITVLIRYFNKNLETARLYTDTRVSGIASAVQDYGVKPENIKTGHISIEKEYEGYRRERKLKGYTITKTITIKISDMTAFDDVIAIALDMGAERIYDISFKSSEIHKYRKEAVTLATGAAKAKAEAMLAELGLQLGAPISIEENYAELAPEKKYEQRNYSRLFSHSFSESSPFNASISYGDDTYSGSDGMAPGQMVINAEVAVEYAIQ